MTSAWIRRAVSPGDLLETLIKTLAYARGSESVICVGRVTGPRMLVTGCRLSFSKAGKLHITSIDSKLLGVTNDSLLRVACGCIVYWANDRRLAAPPGEAGPRPVSDCSFGVCV
jgi:hypothetical protein